MPIAHHLLAVTDGTAPEDPILGTEAPLSDIHLSRTTWIPCKKNYLTISTKKQLMKYMPFDYTM
jgi:hypothetical protein